MCLICNASWWLEKTFIRTNMFKPNIKGILSSILISSLFHNVLFLRFGDLKSWFLNIDHFAKPYKLFGVWKFIFVMRNVSLMCNAPFSHGDQDKRAIVQTYLIQILNESSILYFLLSVSLCSFSAFWCPENAIFGYRSFCPIKRIKYIFRCLELYHRDVMWCV